MEPERSDAGPPTTDAGWARRGRPSASRLQTWALLAAAMSAVTLVLYGLLLRVLPDLQPPDPDSNSVIVAGFQLLFVVLGALLAVLYAWRYLSVARAVATGTLKLRHRRRLRRARTTAVWSAFMLGLFCVAFTFLEPAALPLAVGCLAAAAGWAVAAVAAVRAERSDAA